MKKNIMSFLLTASIVISMILALAACGDSSTGAAGTTAAAGTEALPEPYYRILEHIGKYFDSSISLKRTPSGKGTMTIRFGSDEEVDRFLKALDDANL